MTRSDAELRALYDDVLETDELVPVARLLDTGYGSTRIPASQRRLPAPLPPLRLCTPEQSGARPAQWVRWLQVPLAACLILALIAIRAGVLAGGDITDLGPLVNEPPPRWAPVLGNFHRQGPFLRAQGKPELLFIGTMVDASSASERWPLVKALNQFGKFVNVRAAVEPICNFGTVSNGRLQHQCLASTSQDPGLATFNLDSANYRSRYLTLVYQDLIDSNLRVHRNLPPAEVALFDRYVRPRADILKRIPNPTWDDLLWDLASMSNPCCSLTPTLPFITVGGYEQTGISLALYGDLLPRTGSGTLSFDTVQQSLRRGRAVDRAPYSLVTDFNAEANLLTALICHADRVQPRSVCSRPTIRAILKHVRS